MPRNILDQNWFDFFNKNGLRWQEGSLFGKNFTADQVGNLYGTAGNIIGTAGDVVNDISNQYYAQNAGRADLANTVSGNSWGDVFSNSDKLSQGLRNINAGITDASDVNNIDALKNITINQQNEVNDSTEIGGVVGSTLGDAGKGAALGSIFGPAGTAVGTIGGAALGGIRSIVSAIMHNENAEEENAAIRRANRQSVNNYYNQVGNITQRQQRDWFMHTPYNYQHAEGGSLDELNGVTKFNVGGSHSENPYEGIQQGIASDGNPNLVEEGEIKYKDYIYSARLKPSKSLLKEFNLPDKYAGKTFAEVADILQKESEDRPHDPISLQTLDDWMSRLAGAQEEYKAKAEQRRLAKAIDSMSDEQKATIMSSLVQPIPQQEGIDLGQPMYASGGKIHIKPSKKGTFTAAAKKHGKSVQAFASQVLANKENYSPAMVKKANFARNAKKFKHEEGGYLFPKGGGLNPFDYATRRLTMPWERIDKLPSLYDQYEEQWINDAANELANMQVEQPAPKEQLMSNEAALAGLDATIESTPSSSSFTFNPEYLRHAPVLGSAEAMLRSASQPKDFSVGNIDRQLAAQIGPIGTLHISGFETPHLLDPNLTYSNNLAILARQLDDVRRNPALTSYVVSEMQKKQALDNFNWQQANNAERQRVATNNLGINKFNAQLTQADNQLNNARQIAKLNLLEKAALADDASKEAWANMYNTTRENFFNQLGNVGRDEWNRNQRDWLLNALGREGLLELLKAGYKIS